MSSVLTLLSSKSVQLGCLILPENHSVLVLGFSEVFQALQGRHKSQEWKTELWWLVAATVGVRFECQVQWVF